MMYVTLFGLLSFCAVALENGLGRTPPMGFNPWNCFGIRRTGQCKLPLPWLPESGQQCHTFNDTVILEIARFVANGPLKIAGYSYINLDCGYSTKRRSNSGHLVVNNTRYPRGLRWLGDEIHALGLKFGMYSSASTSQCCSKIDPDADDGSFGHEVEDAQMFADWGVDFLKHDNCNSIQSSYVAMRDALNKTGRSIFYSVHTDGDLGHAELANMWRTTGDIDSTYEDIMRKALENNVFSSRASPGAWNDPDMLEVGNFFTPLGDAEGRTQFTLWCLMKSPLIIGTDLTNASAATIAILSNQEAIAVNQDALGVQGVLTHTGHENMTQVWSGPLAGGAVAVALLNLGSEAPCNITLDASMLPVEASSVGIGAWHIRNVWSASMLAERELPLSFLVQPHDVAFLVLRPATLAADTMFEIV